MFVPSPRTTLCTRKYLHYSATLHNPHLTSCASDRIATPILNLSCHSVTLHWTHALIFSEGSGILDKCYVPLLLTVVTYHPVYHSRLGSNIIEDISLGRFNFEVL